MVDYKVTVSTSHATTATTFNNVFIKLVGTDGESERKWLIGFRGATAFVKGAVSLKYSILNVNRPLKRCSLLNYVAYGHKGDQGNKKSP